jgi:hypothetical protein
MATLNVQVKGLANARNQPSFDTSCYWHQMHQYPLSSQPQTNSWTLFSEAVGNTVRSESRCALRLLYVDLVVSVEISVEVCCCFTALSC